MTEIFAKPISALVPHKENARVHPAAQLDVLFRIYEAHGWVSPVILWRGGADERGQNLPADTILKGHGWIQMAVRAGLTTAFCAYYDGDKPTAYMLADNHSSDLSSDDDARLAQLLASLDNAEIPLAATGFSDDEFNALLESIAPAKTLTGEGEDAPEPENVEHRVQVGDIWGLGGARLAIGSATNPDLVARLFGDNKARMVWTDPPYGVAYVGKTKKALTIENDAMSEEDTGSLACDALKLAAAHGVAGASCYVASPVGTLLPYFISAVAHSGFTFKHSLVWVKNQFVMCRYDYHSRHELILYGWIENGAHYFIDDRTKDTVFEVDRPRRSEAHPTMKPIALVQQMVENSSVPGEIVYDPFSGSGTTIIACERSGRIGYGCELAPMYGDVILARWEAETTQSAVLLSRVPEK
jgi:DNA modification methylase